MFRVNAAAWKEEAEAAAVADGGSADRNLEDFVADVRSVVTLVSREGNEVDG
jgi:hypothetical protein